MRDKAGVWRLAHPEMAAKHRLNAGIIIDSEMLEVRFRNGRSLGKVEERFAASLRPGDTFAFAGQSLEVEQLRDMEVVVRATARHAMIPSYGGARMPLTTHLADRVRAMLVDLKKRSKRVVGYGAPGKGNTLLNYCGIRTDLLHYVVDRNPYKHGRFTPGTRIPIYPTARIDLEATPNECKTSIIVDFFYSVYKNDSP